ncbi:MAG: cbb3-type cytochrome oxidase maturation protein [Parasphingorhabdus sp.]|jgi:cbb3-type cytochrome oxidase maturation protein
MDILYLLIPLSIALVLIIAGVFLWSVKSGQFDDLEGQGQRILFDDDAINKETKNNESMLTNDQVNKK